MSLASSVYSRARWPCQGVRFVLRVKGSPMESAHFQFCFVERLWVRGARINQADQLGGFCANVSLQNHLLLGRHVLPFHALACVPVCAQEHTCVKCVNARCQLLLMSIRTPSTLVLETGSFMVWILHLY